MKVVIHTQHRENYAAHDWDGKGECPQYWKMKGGNTYIVHGVSIADNMSEVWWKRLEGAVESFSEYFEEYIIGCEVIDEIDFDESAHVEDWDSPINLVLVQGRFLATRHTKFQWCTPDGFVGKLEQWVQANGGRDEYVLMYERDDSTLVTYQEWVESQKEVI